jgi:hypothetical protein
MGILFLLLLNELAQQSSLVQALSDGHCNSFPQVLESAFQLSGQFFHVFGHKFFF